uniref:Slc6a-17 n=1 Tax=Schmidtea mediterranea TaxID=79327 RepID=A0A0H3YF56_SCHMD|nr:slc6a-17 [Schmidtea mediterranea]
MDIKNVNGFSPALHLSKFGKSKLTPEGPHRTDDSSYSEGESVFLRGKWTSRKEFILSCIGFAVGLGNVWRFPIRCYESGGGAFLFLYVILCVILGAPLLFVELGIGQFSSRSPTTAFKLVPIFYGIGWSMIFISSIVEVYYAVVISWAFIYLFGSFHYIMPWTVCNQVFNSKNCISSGLSVRRMNLTSAYITSTEEYWDYYVTGFFKYPERTFHTMDESPGYPQWHVTLSLMLTWILTGLSLMFGVKVSSKVLYFTVIFPYVVMTCLIVLGCSLPGASTGIYFYLVPDWKKVVDPKVILGVIEQLLFSSNIAMGGMLTYASYNNFRENIYQDTFIIVFIDFITSFLSGISVFAILGYMAEKSGVPINKVITSGEGLFYITYTDAIATLPGCNFWNFMFMLMAIALGLDSQFAPLECISAGIGDVYPFMRKTKLRKALLIWSIIGVHFLAGIMLCSPGGKYWFVILDSRVSTYGLTVVAFLEIIIVGIIYGFRQLHYDFSVMMALPIDIIWMILIAFICPTIIFLILITNIFTYKKLSVAGVNIPLWGEIVAFLFLALVLLPILTGMIHTVIKYKIKYPQLRGKEFYKKLFTAPNYWGPYHLRNWLYGKYYRDKLLAFKDNPVFLKYRAGSENINHYVEIIKKSHK